MQEEGRLTEEGRSGSEYVQGDKQWSMINWNNILLEYSHSLYESIVDQRNFVVEN